MSRYLKDVCKRIQKSGGPIAISALSLFISFHLLQPLALWLDPSFNFLATKRIGKIAFITMVIYQGILLFTLLPNHFLKNFFTTNISFFWKRRWFFSFLLFFLFFSGFHVVTLFLFHALGFATTNPSWGTLSTSLALKLFLGFIATFTLAWSEETIFRGTVYPYFVATFSPLTSAVVTSFIFSLAHDLTGPWHLFCGKWRLGLGLFLLGLLLNLIFIITGTLYAGMGAHAGLVFVKVFLRRAPVISFSATSTSSWLLAADLRQAHIVHLFFILAIIGLLIACQRKGIELSRVPEQ